MQTDEPDKFKSLYCEGSSKLHLPENMTEPKVTIYKLPYKPIYSH